MFRFAKKRDEVLAELRAGFVVFCMFRFRVFPRSSYCIRGPSLVKLTGDDNLPVL